jgi:hypothetical protein
VFDRHPGATVILGHMGEFLPFQTSRLDSRYLIIETDSPLQRMPSEYIGSNIRITTSGVFAPVALTGAVLAIGSGAIMFSIDYPCENTQDAVTGFERTTLSPADRSPARTPPRSCASEVRSATKGSLMVGVAEGREVQAGAGKEAFEERGPVLHPPEPGLHQGGQLGEVASGQVCQGPFQMRPDWLSRFAIVHASLGRRV